jgi:hypothetical protein
MKRVRLIFQLLILVLCPAGVSAQVGAIDDWLSGRNQVLIRLLMTEIDQLANMTEMLANMQLILEASNEGLALARSTYRAYKSVRDYSANDFIRDAKEGMYSAFPHLQGIEDEWITMKDQFNHGDNFFSYYGHYDQRMDQKMVKILDHAYTATIWPTVFPNSTGLYPKTLNPVDVEIWAMYHRTGQEAKIAVQKTAIATLAATVAEYVREAKSKKQLDLLTQATTAQLMVQEVNNSTEFVELYKTKIAKEEAARQSAKVRRETVRSSLTSRAYDMFSIGTMRRE